MEMMRMVSMGPKRACPLYDSHAARLAEMVFLNLMAAIMGTRIAYSLRRAVVVPLFGVPDSAGVPADLAQHTYTLPYNDSAALRSFFERHGAHIATVILEPVTGNMGVIRPDQEFPSNDPRSL